MLASIGQLSHDAPEISETDIEDAMAFHRETIPEDEDEDMMVDDVPDEDRELEAMFASYEEQRAAPSQPSQLSKIPDDEDYDDLFAELIAKEQRLQQLHQQTQSPSSIDDMDIMDQEF